MKAKEEEIEELVSDADKWRSLVTDNVSKRLTLIKARIEKLDPQLGHPQVVIRVELDNFSIFPLVLERTTYQVSVKYGSRSKVLLKDEQKHDALELPAQESTILAHPLQAGIDVSEQLVEWAKGYPEGEFRWHLEIRARFTSDQLPDGGFDHTFDLSTPIRNDRVIPQPLDRTVIG